MWCSRTRRIVIWNASSIQIWRIRSNSLGNARLIEIISSNAAAGCAISEFDGVDICRCLAIVGGNCLDDWRNFTLSACQPTTGTMSFIATFSIYLWIVIDLVDSILRHGECDGFQGPRGCNVGCHGNIRASSVGKILFPCFQTEQWNTEGAGGMMSVCMVDNTQILVLIGKYICSFSKSTSRH